MPTVPALVPILCRTEWANELKGVTLPNVGVSVWQPAEITAKLLAAAGKSGKAKPKLLDSKSNSFLFTHWGFSGPAVLDVSRHVAMHPNKNQLDLVCDFLPETKMESLIQILSDKKQASGKQSVNNLLSDYFPKRFAETLISTSGVSLDKKNAELSKQQLRSIGEQVKLCRFAINGTLEFEKAEVTAGGISLKEVNGKTMESKLQPGLFFAGEILDLDGPIGGFNFQAAFSTGWLAGQSI